MSHSARETASEASFQALANCYLREVDGGVWHRAKAWQVGAGVALYDDETHVIELELPLLDATVLIGVSYRSLVGRHTLTKVHRRSRAGGSWQRLDRLSAQVLLIDAVYARQPESEQRLELLARVLESHQVMGAYLDAWLERSTEPRTFIESEQSVLLGHWLHPTPKSRQGIHAWQHPFYAPELGARFQLHFFAAHRELVQQDSIAGRPAEELSRRLATRDLDLGRAQQLAHLLGDDYCFLPLHPLQAHWLLHQKYVLELLSTERLLDVGRLGPLFTPTSSVRTVYCESEDFMLKLSLPVKITNSLRVNLQSELGDSVWVTKLLRGCKLAGDLSDLRPIEDPAYISLALPSREETGFEAIFRHNPFKSGALATGEVVHSVAALVQDPLPGRSRSELVRLVEKLARREHATIEQASRTWFDAYFHCAIDPVLRLYDGQGIALEAHQQNTLLGLTPSGKPHCAYYRDIQGVGLAESFRDRILEQVPELALQPKVFEADELVQNGLGYYLFFNQLFSVINRFGLDGLLDEEELLELIRQKLLELRGQMQGPGVAFIDVFLQSEAIPCKANLLTRVADVDELQAENELGVYCLMDNPLAVEQAASMLRLPTSAPSHRGVSVV